MHHSWTDDASPLRDAASPSRSPGLFSRCSHESNCASPSMASLSPGLGALALEPAFGPTLELEEDPFPSREADASTPPPSAPKARRLAEDRFVVEEATIDDAETIIELTQRVNMEGATSFVWPLEDLRARITERKPLIIVAFDTDEESDGPHHCVGVAGIDVYGMEKDFPVMSIGSRFSETPAQEVYNIPSDFCMCRGLLVDNTYQGCGLGSLLHKTRINLLRQIAPHTPSVVLSARGSSFQEARVTLGPALSKPNDITPAFAKEELFEFTFPTSKGVVHLAHNKEDDGWKFVGVDVSDGGPVWCTTLELAALTRSYSHLGSSHRLASFIRRRSSTASLPVPQPSG